MPPAANTVMNSHPKDAPTDCRIALMTIGVNQGMLERMQTLLK